MGGDTLQFLHDMATNGAKQLIRLFAELGLAVSSVDIRLLANQLRSYLGQPGSQARTEKAIIAHLDESFRQHMLEKAADEFFSQ